MIERVQFENFKSLANVAIELGRLTALVGANGCGKSSVLHGMYLLSQTGIKTPHDLDIDIKRPFGRFASIYDRAYAPHRLIFRGRTGMMVLAARRSGGDELHLAISVLHRDGHSPSFSFVVKMEQAPRILCQVPPHPAGDWSAVYAVLDDDRVQRFASAAYMRLDANAMVRTTIADDEIPRMDLDGDGLASVLAWMKGAAEDELAQVTLDLRTVVPGVKRIKTYRERVANRRMETIHLEGQPVWRPIDETRTGDRFALEFDDGSEVPADLLSEGTVLALGLFTKLREPGRPRLFLLDDIGRGLHLAGQAKLVGVLRELMKLDPELQIVCTTHSPYLLDLFEPREVRVLALDSERRTHARPLIEHPEFDQWKFGTQTGELWAALGEDWVLPGSK